MGHRTRSDMLFDVASTLPRGAYKGAVSSRGAHKGRVIKPCGGLEGDFHRRNFSRKSAFLKVYSSCQKTPRLGRIAHGGEASFRFAV